MLVFSPLTPFQQFGVLAITIVYALITAVLVVLRRWSCGGSYQNLRLRRVVERAGTKLGSSHSRCFSGIASHPHGRSESDEP